jgi:hypothetical protein
MIVSKSFKIYIFSEKKYYFLIMWDRHLACPDPK